MNRSVVLSVILAFVLAISLAGCLHLGFDQWSDDSDDSSDLENDGYPTSDDPDDEDTETGDDETGDEESERDTESDDDEESERDTESDDDEESEEVPDTDDDDENVTATFLTSEGNVTVTLEVAATSEERSEGLMHRESLPENHGMVFVYSEADDRSFWMKNTLIPLDIIFIDSEQTVLNVEEADPQPNASTGELETYSSDGPAQYVIELEQGFSEEYGIEPGTEVVFHDDLHADQE